MSICCEWADKLYLRLLIQVISILEDQGWRVSISKLSQLLGSSFLWGKNSRCWYLITSTRLCRLPCYNHRYIASRALYTLYPGYIYQLSAEVMYNRQSVNLTRHPREPPTSKYARAVVRTHFLVWTQRH